MYLKVNKKKNPKKTKYILSTLQSIWFYNTIYRGFEKENKCRNKISIWKVQYFYLTSYFEIDRFLFSISYKYSVYFLFKQLS